MSQIEAALERLPVATLVHLLVSVILGLDLLIHGNLSQDALTYAGIVEGGNVGVGLGRAHVKAAKVKAGISADAPPEVP